MLQSRAHRTPSRPDTQEQVVAPCPRLRPRALPSPSSPGLWPCRPSLLGDWPWRGPSCPWRVHSSFPRNVLDPGSHRGAEPRGVTLNSGCCFAAEKAILLNSAKPAHEQGMTKMQEFQGQWALTRAGPPSPCGSAGTSSETHSN